MRHALLAGLLLVLCAGCGSNTIRVATVPAGARLTVNGEYVGKTPYAVPQHWTWWWGDSTKLLIEMDGYRPVEKTIQHLELRQRAHRGDKIDNSEFGWGATFVYQFVLDAIKPEPAKPVDGAAAPKSN